MRHKSSGPKCDKMFSRISSGRSFIDLGWLATTDGSEHTSFRLLYEGNAKAICKWSKTGSKILKHKHLQYVLTATNQATLRVKNELQLGKSVIFVFNSKCIPDPSKQISVKDTVYT